MLGPVEFDAAADPGPGQAHQGGLDDPVVIHEIIAVGLVQGPLDAAAQLRQDHDVKVIVLQNDGPVGYVFFGIADLFRYGEGVYLARGALVGAFFDEQRAFFGRGGFVGGDDYGLFIQAYPVHGVASFR